MGKRVRSLKKRPKESIRSLASEVFQTWKALFIKQLNKEERDSSTPAKTNPIEKTKNKADDVLRHMIMKISSVSSDNIGVSRCKIRERLVVALSRVAAETEEESLKHQVEACDPVEVAVAVETAMFEKIKGQNKKIRSILFNMSDSKNPDLRRKVLMGEVKPEKLVIMSNTEMASEELQLRIKQIEEKSLEKCLTGRWTSAEEKATTDQFRCGKCGQRKTTYHQLQTRSADEPMTTYVTCVNCNNHWKFC